MMRQWASAVKGLSMSSLGEVYRSVGFGTVNQASIIIYTEIQLRKDITP